MKYILTFLSFLGIQFKRKIYLPAWFGFLPGAPITPEQEEYYETITKISKYLVDNPNNSVILKIDGEPHRIFLENGDWKKTMVVKLKKDEYEYDI